MCLILYSKETETGTRLQELMESTFPQKKLEVCKTMDTLCQRLQQCFDGMVVVVLVAGSREELHDLLGLQKLLSDLRIILILSGRHRDTVRKAHALRPRFLTYADGNLDDVAAVLGKMLNNNR